MDVSSLIELKKNPKIPELSPGDTVKVSARIVEAGKERIQVFQGVVIKIRRGGASASFTVRHVAYGIGVERTFPLYSPLVEKVEIVRHGKVRRSKLYYLRGLSGKEARRKIKRVEKKAVVVSLVLAVTTLAKLDDHLLRRSREQPDRDSELHRATLANIWQLQTFMVDQAEKAGIPVIANWSLAETVARVMDEVMSRIGRRFPPDPDVRSRGLLLWLHLGGPKRVRTAIAAGGFPGQFEQTAQHIMHHPFERPVADTG